MKWYSTYRHPDKIFFIIERDENVGYYVYLYYEDFSFFEKDIKRQEGCPNHQDDWLQDSLEQAKGFSLRKFGVPLDSWVQAVPSEG